MMNRWATITTMDIFQMMQTMRFQSMIIEGFFIVAKGGKYYKGGGDYVLNREEAYQFLMPHLAERLANRIGGKVERV